MTRASEDTTRTALVLLAAAGVLTSGYIHFYLYFEGGYRGIAPESFGGLTISRAFAVNAIAGLVLAELLVASLFWARLSVPAAAASLGFAAFTLSAYGITRTVGLLGFTETTTSTEAIIAIVAETLVLIVTATLLVRPRAPQLDPT